MVNFKRVSFLLPAAAALLLAPGIPAQGGGANNKVVAYINTLPKQAVSSAEKADLVMMRQEEKLARDVYKALYYFWKLPVFNNIAKAEQAHMDLVKVILDRYSIKDPIKNDIIGLFPDRKYTDLFFLLVVYGAQSKTNALMVGALIEDLDIEDLLVALKKSDNRDIDTVYQNLCKGSRNHMRASYGQLKAANVTYKPFFITQTYLDWILSNKWEKGAVDENGKLLP